MSRDPGPDERRVRYLLARLDARPFGHSNDRTTAMSDQPITPTRIIPAGVPLPARPPQPGEVPPWRTPTPATAAPPPPPPPPPIPRPPDPAEVVVRHVHEVLLVTSEPEERVPRLWERLWDHLFTWRMLVAILAALMPWANGRSPVGIWAHTVHQARTEAGIPAAYIIAGVALGAAWALDRHTGRALPRFLFVTALIGAFGVFDWFDAITLLTGVSR
ncbi:hypothetical protein OG194_29700 [Streptomyces sp. NBC_01288]|uniref:hypothetical protein n=1 Tax=Streptomyces sp. NBC_01288 TaxID=2903814 RepID=UPI002E10EE23|nr:hypothetical protein OG194_29700 [Streptomyces sp. NBC_01288]